MAQWKPIFTGMIGMRQIQLEADEGNMYRVITFNRGTQVTMQIHGDTPGDLEQHLREQGEFSDTEPEKSPTSSSINEPFRKCVFMRPRSVDEREQSQTEEIANSISHGMALFAAILGTPFLIMHASAKGDAGYIAGTILFCACAILFYFSSTVYHALPSGETKKVFRLIDHCAIFLLIAGTYTPFTLGVLRSSVGWLLFSAIWGLAAAGVMLKMQGKISHPWISTGLYLLMGWLIVAAGKQLLAQIPFEGLLWLLAGGLSYTVGVVFYAIGSKLKYGHTIWHLFVILGTVCHYFAVLWYAA